MGVGQTEREHKRMEPWAGGADMALQVSIVIYHCEFCVFRFKNFNENSSFDKHKFS